MRPRIPLAINILLIAAGGLTIGARAAEVTAANDVQSSIRTIIGPTPTVYSTRTVKRVVRGHIVHQEDKVYVKVPLLIVRTDHHTIKVPAHKIPLRSAAATIANPLVTVYVPLQGDTVYVPTTVTSTETIQVPTTVTDTVTATVSVPLPTTSDQGGTQ